MRKPKTPLAAAILLLIAALPPIQADAKSFGLIRDSEIENIIRVYATPLFQAAGLNPSEIDLFLVNDLALNAFATPGQKMFIHTGLLIRAEDPLEVIGVIAHETGHLAAGHTATRGKSQRDATSSMIASYVLGLAAGAASGRPELAVAVVGAGQDIALKGLLRYTRGQESAADQIAVDLLNATQQSPRGLLAFMNLLRDQELLHTAAPDPYLRTHPLTTDRISFLEDQVGKSPSGNRAAPAALLAMHARMRAKLIGFLLPRDQVFDRYPEPDAGVPARYARAIARFRSGELEAALAATDALLAEYPDDPYFPELKGQMLFESGRIGQAVKAYGEAARLLPDAPQIQLMLAQAQLEMNDPALDRAALEHLRATLRAEPSNAFAWRLSAIAHGRGGDLGMTALALAESALAGGEAPEARNQAIRAQRILAEGTAAWLRARDLEDLARRRERKQ